MAKSLEKQKARKLRRGGLSIKKIASKLDVSQSSVSLWCRDVKLTPKQIARLEKNAHDPLYGKRLDYALKQQKIRLIKTQKLMRVGVKDIGSITRRELFLIGVALYWAEGFKKDSQAGFANSNPKMISLFLRWIDECCGFNKNDLALRVTLNSSHKYRAEEIQDYWSKITGIDREYFQKPYYQNVIWKKIYENPNNYYGVLRIKVRRSTDFLRKINGWIEGLGRQANNGSFRSQKKD